MHALVHGVCMQGGVWVCSGVAVSGNSLWLGRVGLCRDAHMILSPCRWVSFKHYINETNNHNSLGHEQPLSMSLNVSVPLKLTNLTISSIS